MIDATTRKPLSVSTDGGYKPYIMVAVDQLAEVLRALDGADVSYEVEENVISLNGSPEIATIDLAWKTNVDAVQAILDSIH